LLFALPLLKEDSTIIVTEPFESRQYVNMTLDMLKLSGIEIEARDNTFLIKGNQSYSPFNIQIEGDFSQMAFYAVMGLIGSRIECRNVPAQSSQPDFRLLEFINSAKGKYTRTENGYQFIPSKTIGANYDVSQSPDIAPVLAIMAALSEGSSRIENASRLKFKESNRLLSTFNTLKELGVKVEIEDDSLLIFGQESFDGGVFDSYNDHRIVMAVAAASVRATRQIIIKNAEAVNKSYPNFFEDFKSLGAKIEIIEE
ncbi:MAG: 3-phosphoshikimate 1-carboxyvinyltransferase, partial [Bacilli bacterium]|nr:3-phosphoshikimate 1-carboxyvinyltransferase [Bacilli bacterium]